MQWEPFFTTITVIAFYVFFNMLEALIEKLIFGERFEHWLDVFFCIGFIAFAAYCVTSCATYNRQSDDRIIDKLLEKKID